MNRMISFIPAGSEPKSSLLDLGDCREVFECEIMDRTKEEPGCETVMVGSSVLLV